MYLKRAKNLSVRLPEEDLEKLRLIAERECRTCSGQAMVWIRKSIQEYEKIHGFVHQSENNQ